MKVFFNTIQRRSDEVVSEKVCLHSRLEMVGIQCLQVKEVLITLFNYHRVVQHKLAARGQTVNQHFSKEVLTFLLVKIIPVFLWKKFSSVAGDDVIEPASSLINQDQHFLVSSEGTM